MEEAEGLEIDVKVLDAYLSSLFEKQELPGISVALWGPEGPVFQRGYGRANEDGSRMLNENTVQGIASMGKSMVALACAILAADGKLSFDDPVYRYFPQFDIPGTPRDAVTVRHLAMHTTGIPPMETLEWSIAMHVKTRQSEWAKKLRETAPNAFDTVEQIIDYIKTCGYPALGAPGEYMSYSNEGYAILCYIVDKAAGCTLEELLQERVWGPLGMTRTVLDVDGTQARAIAGGNITSLFERVDGKLVCDDEWSVLPPFRGCAVVKSTARDMAVYYRCLSNYGRHEGKQAIAKEAVEMMIGSQFPVQRAPFYCYGLNKRALDGHVVCEHSGGLHGTSSHGGLFLGEGYGFAALCNQGDAGAEAFVWAMYNAVMGKPVETPLRWFAPAGREFGDPQMVVGTFRSHEGVPVDVTVTEENGKLFAQREEEKLPLTYCGGTLFAAYDEKGNVQMRLESLIRGGKAWAARVGTRILQRVEA